MVLHSFLINVSINFQTPLLFLSSVLLFSVSLLVCQATFSDTWRRCDRSEELFIAEQGRKVIDNLQVTRMPGDIPARARSNLIRKVNV